MKNNVYKQFYFRASSEALSDGEPEHASFPPRGWNSYDSFCWTISEEEFLQSAEIVSNRLRPHGYEVFRLLIHTYFDSCEIHEVSILILKFRELQSNSQIYFLKMAFLR